MTGVLVLEFLALALALAFFAGALDSSSEFRVGEELARVTEEESEGEESCLRFLDLGMVGFLLAGRVCQKCKQKQRGEGRESRKGKVQ